MKSRIFIGIHYLELGGAEISLIGLLQALDYEKVDVDLFVYSHQGELMKMIPKGVNLLPEIGAYSVMERPMKEALKRGYIGVFLERIIAKRQHKRYLKRLSDEDRKNDISIFPMVSNCVMPFLPSLKKYGEYDLAVSFLQPHDIVRRKVSAKRYWAWIHTDYSTVHVNKELEEEAWATYDNIISISKDCTKGFLERFPSMRLKIIEIENILPKRMIEAKAGENVELPENSGVMLLSVGRICEAKNYDNIPYMAERLQQLGLDFHWYIIGPGNHAQIDALSRKLGVDGRVAFIGAKSNPYPYIKRCDIYVHPSRYEGKSIVVREAQVLHKPVIITNYPTAHSQIKDGVDGVICEMDNTKIAEAIFDLANDEQKRKEIIAYLDSHDYAGLDEVNKIYEML